MKTTHCPFVGFDIETKPDPAMARTLFRPLAPFNADDVKTGNIKDPVLKRAKIEEARQKHEDEGVAALRNMIDRAALSPLTGSILVLGLISGGLVKILDGDEREILETFWAMYSQPGMADRKWVFWSGTGAAESQFDLDFIYTRSLILNVEIPPGVRGGRYYGGRLVDLAGEFLLFKREAYLSLTSAAEVFRLYDVAGLDITRKTDADLVHGKDFWRWWEGAMEGVDQWAPDAAEQRAFALRYLHNDLHHLAAIAGRML